MTFFRNRRSGKRRTVDERPEIPEPEGIPSPGGTGAEAAYLKSLVDSRATVTVVLDTGERLLGRIRYYDRDCFSLGIVPRGPNLFIRKSVVRCIIEE